MMASQPPSASAEHLIEVYRDAAIAHRSATREGDYKRANLAYERLMSVVRELRDRSNNEREVFLDLLDDPLIEVRGLVAAHALEFAPDKAEPVLEEIASGPESLEEFSARMVLQEWRQGRLRFP